MPTSLVGRVRDDRAIALLVAALGAALVVSLVLLVAVWHDSAARRSIDAAQTDALVAARGYAVDVTTYDYQQLDKDFSWIDDGATPAFARQYRDANQPLRSIIEKLKATATGSVSAAAATASSAGKVRVLVFIDQRITNASGKDPKIEHSRVVMDMVKRGGTWLVDDVQLR